jgi:hypothetical protein
MEVARYDEMLDDATYSCRRSSNKAIEAGIDPLSWLSYISLWIAHSVSRTTAVWRRNAAQSTYNCCRLRQVPIVSGIDPVS